jgi:CobQ-like glutamine amidotransferase family enzyme
VITVVHLYPRELGINGDVGNVTALHRRAAWRGLEVRVAQVGAGDSLPDDAHVVHIGSGPASARQPLHSDIARHAATLREWAADGVPFLAIAAGWQLLGREVTELDGTVSPGAGVFPSTARVSADRTVGEVAGESELGELAGFVNYGADTTVDTGVARLARLRDHDDGDAYEGIAAGDLVATNLHGPFLPMNPVWADRLLEAAAHRAGVTLGEPDPWLARVDDYARRSRAAIRARL